MLTYSSIVFCSSTGKANSGGTFGEFDSIAAEPAEEDWVMVSPLGAAVALPAIESDIVRRSRCVSVPWCECGERGRRNVWAESVIYVSQVGREDL